PANPPSCSRPRCILPARLAVEREAVPLLQPNDFTNALLGPLRERQGILGKLGEKLRLLHRTDLQRPGEPEVVHRSPDLCAPIADPRDMIAHTLRPDPPCQLLIYRGI